MTEKDNIQDLFSKAFENQTTSVRPELWQGVQSKMAAAGMATGSAAAVKGVSVLTKWIIGTAAVGSIAVTTYMLTAKEEVKSPKPVIEETNSSSESPLRNTNPDETLSLVAPKQETPAIAQQPDELVTSLQEEFDEISQVIPQEIAPQEVDRSPKKTDPATPVVPAIPKADPKKGDPVTPSAQTPNETHQPVNTVLAAKLTHFPNVFTPNNDGQNDLYSVRIENDEVIDVFLIQIYNEKNQLVYYSSDPRFTWNGEYQGEVNAGMYFCLVTIIDKSGNTTKDKQLLEIRK